MKLSPKTKRNIARIIPFGIIWLVTGCVFILVETAAMGTPTPGSPTIIDLTFSVVLFAIIAATLVGFLVGAIELTLMENLFQKKSFVQKVIYKFGLYLLLMLLIIAVTYPIAASFEAELPLFDQKVWNKFSAYLGSVTFLSTLLQMASSLFLCVIYAAISEHLGHHVLINFFTGRYHRPLSEERIFMFLDMNSSTTIAEQLGNVRYFELLREFYADLSDGIINHAGEVYQYIGDEVIISWKIKAGLENANCVRCFFAMKQDQLKRSAFYQERFGVIPTFKAGIHLGEVTAGEIGALKKEIFFTGDVLNATARIQGMCKQYQQEILASEDLVKQLPATYNIQVTSMGITQLRGKAQEMELFALEEVV